MDAKDNSIVSQVCLKVSATIYTSLADCSVGFQPELLETIYRKVWSLHSETLRAQSPPPQAVQPQPQQAAPFDPRPAAPQPVPVSQPVAQPSAPQPVLNGPPCPNCQTPMSMTPDFYAKKAANMAKGKKAPPLWRCPMGTYDPATKQSMGCQGVGWETAA